jgi:hypothetical protein
VVTAKPLLPAAAGALAGLLVAGIIAGTAGNEPATAEPPIAPVVTSEPPPEPAGVPADGSDAAPTLATLETLAIKGRAPKTGYDRDLFGPSWSDDVTVAGGLNGCDTRNDILRRDLTDIVVKPGTNDCVVLSGTLDDPYTATSIDFQRGEQTSWRVQIDHVVALSDAWQKGAQQWDEPTRRNFANDPINLQATDGPANEQKRDGDAATWLPPNKSYRCTYVTRMVEIKAAYRLWVTQAEHDAIAGILTTGCDGPPAEAPAAAPPPQDPAAVFYPNCSAARAAGAAPLYAGEPGYRPELDGDDDGIACE